MVTVFNKENKYNDTWIARKRFLAIAATFLTGANLLVSQLVSQTKLPNRLTAKWKVQTNCSQTDLAFLWLDLSNRVPLLEEVPLATRTKGSKRKRWLEQQVAILKLGWTDLNTKSEVSTSQATQALSRGSKLRMCIQKVTPKTLQSVSKKKFQGAKNTRPLFATWVRVKVPTSRPTSDEFAKTKTWPTRETTSNTPCSWISRRNRLPRVLSFLVQGLWISLRGPIWMRQEPRCHPRKWVVTLKDLRCNSRWKPFRLSLKFWNEVFSKTKISNNSHLDSNKFSHKTRVSRTWDCRLSGTEDTEKVNHQRTCLRRVTETRLWRRREIWEN